MKIYTKKGDTGQTSLIGGTRVSKSSTRINSYGSVDELNSHIGLLNDLVTDVHVKEILTIIQNKLFTVGSNLAADPVKSKMQLPQISESDIYLLENEMDKMNEKLPELTNFILPGGHPHVSQSHICRTVCRRSERIIVELAIAEKVDPLMIKYLNRLSDYFFVLARYIAFLNNAKEIIWKS